MPQGTASPSANAAPADPVDCLSPSPPAPRAARPRHAPLLALVPAAVPDEPPDEEVPSIWTVISRASDLVKDGERLENLAWRHWGAPTVGRRRSSSTLTTSSAEIGTPSDRGSIPRTRSFERRSFAGTLRLLVEESSSFKDWVEDARLKHPASPQSGTADTHPPAHPSSPVAAAATATPPPIPTVSLPHCSAPETPVSLEIRLVEPTPVPSRVGSLGGSLDATRSVAAKTATQPLLREDIDEEAEADPATTASATAPSAPAGPAAPQPRGRRAAGGRSFFIQSSPGKVSGSESSPQSASAIPPPAQAPPEPETNHVSSQGSNFRSSDDSSSAIVIKKKEKRHVSMANMRGRFQGEKARAAQAIADRNKKESSDEWEDEDEEEDEDEWEDDEPAQDTNDDPPAPHHHQPPHAAPEPHRRATEPIIPQAPTPPRTKKERAAEKARADAQRDAQRKREMFAKQAIFGAKVAPSEGLLTRTFNIGKSMIDLTQAGREDDHDELRRAPTLSHLGQLSMSPAMASPSGIMRSKSSAALPVQTGVSVTSRSHLSNSGDKRCPVGVEMETSDEESDDDYLQSEEVRAKLNALAAKREARDRAKVLAAQQQQQQQEAESLPAVTPPITAVSPVNVQATPVPVVPRGSGELDENGIVRPLSPTSRRRTIIMREMSESLRKNIIVEREKSSGRGAMGGSKFGQDHKRPPPGVHMSRLPTSSSAVNLAQLHNSPQHTGEALALARVRSNQVTDFKPHNNKLERHSSHPNLTAMGDHDNYTTQPPPPRPVQESNSRGPSPNHWQASSSTSPEARRRANVLGSGFLRPLTRVGGDGELGRARSTVALTTMTSPTAEPMHSSHSPTTHMPSSGSSGALRSPHLQAAPMMRSNTEGAGSREMERARVRRELAKRSEHTDTSYRMHGW
ncbi:uncharacterized protein EHS24_008993 [Apiotrichum porosum]|uniref:Nitrogen regulatory protein areA GATA-like domain-containing protein n=1 Tax=Apiotrichum porosum TaxID=105984 RepID=A0A427XNC9_9TREE|nr:uncharacterized protein EHS24_008993 [Apiotrichum porosum]RSH80415.1 hypothetical protein EHS24_008993 [Apiotrichum porosum]